MHTSSIATDRKEFRYSKRLVYVSIILALVFFFVSFEEAAGSAMHLGAWLIPVGLALFALQASIYWYRYRLVIDGDRISVHGFRKRHFVASEIVAMRVWMSGGARYIVVMFRNGAELTAPSYLADFNQLIGILRDKAKLTDAVWE